MQEYITVGAAGRGEYIEKRSKFISCALHCTCESQAAELLSKIRSDNYGANHNVYAYVLRDGTARFSDDGEPHGTGGRPILDEIYGSAAVDVLVVVTRYFGGVLLGTGGLSRAYSSAARSALDDAQKVKMCDCDIFSVLCDYSDHARLVSLIKDRGGIIQNTEFSDKVKLCFAVKSDCSKSFTSDLREAFAARIEAKHEKVCCLPFKI